MENQNQNQPQIPQTQQATNQSLGQWDQDLKKVASKNEEPQKTNQVPESWESLQNSGQSSNAPKPKKKKLNLNAQSFQSTPQQTVAQPQQTQQQQQQPQQQLNQPQIDLYQQIQQNQMQPQQAPIYQQCQICIGTDYLGYPQFQNYIYDQYGNYYIYNQYTGQLVFQFTQPLQNQFEQEYEDPNEQQEDYSINIQTQSKEMPDKKKNLKKQTKKDTKKQDSKKPQSQQQAIQKIFPKKPEVDKNYEQLQQLIKSQKKYTLAQLVELEKTQFDKEKYTEVDKTKDPINIVFIGHVDHGKSTLAGRVLKDTGEVNEAEIRKYELEAQEKHRDNWYLAYIVDINEEERAKGKTVECGRGYFQLKKKRFILLDAPGHKNYVPNMIAGACQADVATLVVSAKSGEFEAGFNSNGQTQEHAQLAKALGVQHVIVAITKMDTVKWKEDRYKQIKQDIGQFLEKSCGFKSVEFVPINSYDGQNVSTPVQPQVCNWYKGPCLFDFFDNIPILQRSQDGPIRMPVLDVIKDQGVIYVTGKIESGTIKDNMYLLVSPHRNRTIQVKAIYNGRLKEKEVDDNKEQKEQQVMYASTGENVKLRIIGMDEKELDKGYVLCQLDDPCIVTKEFMAKLTLLELPDHKRIMSQGYKCMLHMHTQLQEVQISEVKSVYDHTSKKEVVQSFLKSLDQGCVIISSEKYLCLEKFEKIPQLGRFTLRDENKTIGFGEVLKYKPITASAPTGNQIVLPTQIQIAPSKDQKATTAAEEQKVDGQKKN